MKIKRLASFVAIFAITTVAFTILSSTSASAATCEWTGGRSNNNWSTVENNQSNWTCGGQAGLVPQNRDHVVFPGGDITAFNDMVLPPNESFVSVRFGVDGSSYKHVMQGDLIRTDTITFASPGPNNSGFLNLGSSPVLSSSGGLVKELIIPERVQVRMDELYTAPSIQRIWFKGAGSISVGANDDDYGLVASGDRVLLEFSESVNATIGGKTGVWLNSVLVDNAVDHFTVKDNAKVYVKHQDWLGITANILENNGEIKAFAGFATAKPINITGTGAKIAAIGVGSASLPPITLSGNVTIGSPSAIYDADNKSIDLRLTGTISGNGKITPKQGSSGSVVVTGNNTSKTPNGTTIPGVLVTETQSDDTGTVAMVWGYNTLVLNHVRKGATVAEKGILKGNGRLLENTTVREGGIIAPGLSPGNLTVGSLTLAGTYEAEVQNDTFPGGYDRITVTGGNVELDPTSKLDVKLLEGADIKTGNEFLIISNLGPNPVSGTFNGLAEGATVTVGEARFRITYVHNGNSVALIALNDVKTPAAAESAPAVPGTPSTGFSLLTANPLATLMGTLASAGILFAMARKYSLFSK